MSNLRSEANALFDQALDLPEEARTAFLDQHCPSGPVRLLVDDLLAACATEDELPMLDVGGAFGGALGRALGDEIRASQPMPLEPNDLLGPFRIVREIGSGGMAWVYLAERADGAFEQQVALKVVRDARGKDRLNLERQILASLRHPSIAQLIDGGVTADGFPFFAMELVDGQPIDRYCDQRRLTLRRRLRLFLDVVRAVEEAHRALIVHRDIKPSNVFVTGEGRVKLLDFGIAKLLDECALPGELAAQLTRTSMQPMTPNYAAPEQVLGEPVTTAVDIYQLGIVLYELLCGWRPYSLDSLPTSQIVTILCDTAVTAPSVLLARVDAEPAAAARRSNVHQLRRQLKGDLDQIVLKALRKDPLRRYRSAASLADDIERHLAGLPVAARPDSLAYRGLKFAQRNLRALLLVGVMMAILLGVIAVDAVRIRQQRDLARREATRATSVSGFLVEIFEEADPFHTLGDELTARQVLDRGAERLETELLGEPEVQAALMLLVGDIYSKLGLYDQAEPLLEKALHKRRQLLGDRHLDVARVRVKLGVLARHQGRYDSALEHLLEARTVQEALAEPDPEERAATLIALALTHLAGSEVEAAREATRTALGLLPEHSPQLPSVYDLIGRLHSLDGEYKASIEAYDRALTLLAGGAGAASPNRATFLNNLATTLDEMGHRQRAQNMHLQAKAIFERWFGPAHPNVLTQLVNLGHGSELLGQDEQARRYLETAVAGFESSLGPGHPSLAVAAANLAKVLAKAGDHESARQQLDRARQILSAVLDPRHPMMAELLSLEGQLLHHRGQLAEAAARHRGAIEQLTEWVGPEYLNLAGIHLHLALVQLEIGDPGAARQSASRTIEILEGHSLVDHPDLESAYRARALAGLRLAAGSALSTGREPSIEHDLSAADRVAASRRQIDEPPSAEARQLDARIRELAPRR